ncbi:MAG: gamma-glutamyltransferase [Leptolyngbyaceae cyanobacterium SM1_3_5]|nr:gamma-glutamyltransferase [Leptolyngbyaceae cyanobacterium SM1_3_5]
MYKRIRVAAIALCVGLMVLLGRLPLLAQTSVPGIVAIGIGGAVATVDTEATRIGIDILQRGGNAIDAAVATAAALGVVEPFSAGIGGGGFMLIYQKAENRVISIDGREEAPAATTVDLFNDPDTGELLPFTPNRISSGLAVGVPGTLLTWTEALDRYGTLSLSEVLAPAIALAENGFRADPTFVSQIRANQERFAAFTSTRDLYLPDGNLPVVGGIFKNPDQAKTYRLVADRGLNVFYRGEIGEAIVRTVQNPPAIENPPFPVLPGRMTMGDLDDYDLHIRTPIRTDYRGYQLYGMSLPSSGSITGGQVLNLVEGFDLGAIDRPAALNKIIEAERIAFADRAAFLGDPEFVDVPLPGLLSEGYADLRREEIGVQALGGREARAAAGNPLPFQRDPSPSLTETVAATAIGDHEGVSTTHLTVSDRLGNVVSYTLTIEATGGSGIVVPGYGFILNNELTDFDPASPHPNSPEPGKRPRSSMAPTIAFAPDGTVLAYGSPGGSTIITTVLGITTNLIDFGMSIDQAIAAPRLSQRNGGVTQVDSNFELTDLGQALTALGQVLEPVPEIGAATGIVIAPDGRITAAAEPNRRGGGAAMVVRSPT